LKFFSAIFFMTTVLGLCITYKAFFEGDTFFSRGAPSSSDMCLAK
jgi:hypothetical protein